MHKNSKKANSSVIIHSFAGDMDGVLSLRKRTFVEKQGEFEALIAASRKVADRKINKI